LGVNCKEFLLRKKKKCFMGEWERGLIHWVLALRFMDMEIGSVV